MPHKLLRLIVLGSALAGASCASVPTWNAQPAVDNPIFVSSNNQELVTERAVDILHKYNFEVDATNQLEGTIATQYKVGSGLLEPWHKESVGCDNRLESSLQSIRRKVLIHMTPVESGYLLSVEALKEIEDVTGVAAITPGGATFQDNNSLQRDLNLVVGQSKPSGWIPLGRDPALEQDMLRRLQFAYSR